MLYGFVYHITYICPSRRIYPLNPGAFSSMTVLCDRKLWVLLYSWNLPFSIGKMGIIIAEDLGGKKAPSDRNDSSKIQWKTQTPETLSLHLAVSLEAPERVFSIGYYWIYYTRWGKPNCSNITSILYFHCDKKQTFQENNHDFSAPSKIRNDSMDVSDIQNLSQFRRCLHLLHLFELHLWFVHHADDCHAPALGHHFQSPGESLAQAHFQSTTARRMEMSSMFFVTTVAKWLTHAI